MPKNKSELLQIVMNLSADLAPARRALIAQIEGVLP
jgi:hypothetical protein